MLKTMANKNAGDTGEDDAENDGDDLAEVVKLMLLTMIGAILIKLVIIMTELLKKK